MGEWGATLPPEAVRRLACDATLTRAIVHRHPPAGSDRDAGAGGHDHGGGQDGPLTVRLRQAMRVLPVALGGAPPQVLDLGRSTRLVSAGLRRALTLRDGGCVIEGCDRPPAHCDAHHLHHWTDGGPTRLQNLVLVCGRHHTLRHEGGWRVLRDPGGGRVTLSPPTRRWHRRGPPPLPRPPAPAQAPRPRQTTMQPTPQQVVIPHAEPAIRPLLAESPVAGGRRPTGTRPRCGPRPGG